MLFHAILAQTVGILALTSQVRAHCFISPGLGVSGVGVRNDVQKPSTASPCGTASLADIDSSTAAVATNGLFNAVATNFNAGKDGSTALQSATLDTTGTGKSFSGTVTIVKNGVAAPSSVAPANLQLQLPPGTTCTGGKSGNLCLVSTVTDGGFGNCMVVSTGAASTGTTATNTTTTTTTGTTGTNTTTTTTTGTGLTGTTGDVGTNITTTGTTTHHDAGAGGKGPKKAGGKGVKAGEKGANAGAKGTTPGGAQPVAKPDANAGGAAGKGTAAVATAKSSEVNAEDKRRSLSREEARNAKTLVDSMRRKARALGFF